MTFQQETFTGGFPCVQSAVDRDGTRWTCIAGHSPLCPKRYERFFAEARWIVVNSGPVGFAKLKPDSAEYARRRTAFLEEPYVSTALGPEARS